MRALLLGAVALPLTFSACRDSRSAELYDLVRSTRGRLIDHRVSCDELRGHYQVCTVELHSSTGLVASGRMLLPQVTEPVPAVLLNAGLWIGAGVIDALPPDFGDIAVLAMEYPAGIPRNLELSHIVAGRDRLVRSGREIIARFSLAGEFLAEHERIDPARLAIIGGSFAVPFTGLAAALDDRFQNVALIYGAGEFPVVVAANYRFLPGPLNDVAARMIARPFMDLDPTLHVHRIAPRPLLMINGLDDQRMPHRAVRRLFDAAGDPKELVWMRGGHLHSRDSDLIAQLVDTAFSRLPVLRGSFARR